MLGSRSLLSTWLLLIVVFIIYSAVAISLFGDNDPNHFGSVGFAIFSFFQIATFDNWAPIMYINMYGCDRFPSDYVIYNASDTASLPWPQLTVERYGTMYMPLCYSPKAYPIISPILFMSFVVMAGFILISLTVAVVTSGINDRLEELKDRDEEIINDRLKVLEMNRHGSVEILESESSLEQNQVLYQEINGSHSSKEVKTSSHTNPLLYNKEMLLLILEQVNT